MDDATRKYILEMGKELQALVTEFRQISPEELDKKIDVAQTVAFRAGMYWDMLGTIKSKLYS